jgi:membrane dipeptidase
MRSSVKLLVGAAAALVLAAAALLPQVPAFVDRSRNQVHREPPYAATAAARELHQRLVVADLHADSLLWSRNLLQRSARGHVDVPRLLDGNVALQAFTVVSKTPRNQNIHGNDDSSDNITLLSVLQGRPVRTWTSLKERALVQAEALHEAASRSDGVLTLIKTRAELQRYLERRQADPRITAGWLGIEGMHVLEGQIENVDVMFNAGFRMMAPTHFFDNEIGGSAHGRVQGGLTPLGRLVIARMETRRMLVDLAHASSKTIDDVLRISTRPVVVSHTGVRGTCDNPRNLSDDQLRRIAATGGVIGIGYWETAVCGKDAKAIGRAIEHAVRIVGVDHVALGSDFDGAVKTPFDATGTVQVTQSLIDLGMNEDDIRKIMGGNVLRVLGAGLP